MFREGEVPDEPAARRDAAPDLLRLKSHNCELCAEKEPNGLAESPRLIADSPPSSVDIVRTDLK